MMKISKSKNTLIIIIFLFSISIVLFGMMLKLNSFPQNNENRKLAELPSFKLEIKLLRNYPNNIINYFNDHFAFRNTFVRLNFLIRHNLFRESPSRQVVLGKNGWLFYSKEDSIEDYRGITHFDDNTLQNLANSYENKRKFLSMRGIKYILVLAPNKETIYGEWMPDYLYKISNRNGLDEFADYLTKHTSVDIIDVRKTLFDNKMREQLFLKTSSSWNDYAAFLAYREIMTLISQWFPEAHAYSLNEYNIQREEIRGSDLAEMIGGADFIKEKDIFLIPKEPRKARKVDYNTSGNYKDSFGMKMENYNMPRVIIFRDCFFDKIIPFLSEHFEYSKYYWQSWNPDTPIAEMIITVRPDIVIEEKVQRFLKLPKNP